jgi:hypothetical protein
MKASPMVPLKTTFTQIRWDVFQVVPYGNNYGWRPLLLLDCIAIQTHFIWVVGMFFSCMLIWLYLPSLCCFLLFFLGTCWGIFWELGTHWKLKGTPYEHHGHLLGTSKHIWGIPKSKKIKIIWKQKFEPS